MKKFFFIACLILTAFKVNAQTQTVQVKITGIRSEKGVIVLNFFGNKVQYDEQRPVRKVIIDKKLLANGVLSASIEVSAGVYGITIIDDENGNGKIDKNFIGIPKEGFGFSNYYMSGMSKPSFDDFKTDLTQPGKAIVIKVKYM